MSWYWWLLTAFAINWPGCYILCQFYCFWLHRISGDVSFEGWIWWRGIFPIARYQLISKKSWFARIWLKWYGHGLLGCIIHRDEKGAFDDEYVEEVIVHEVRHSVQQLFLGLMFYVVYGIDFLFHGHLDNIFEVDARRAVLMWIVIGRPRIFKFGKRS